MALDLDIGSLTMTEIIRLQDMLSRELVRRFEHLVALAFSDVADSTAYFAQFGDEEGRRLQQRHVDLLLSCLPQVGGRIVDTAGDGAFLCFPSVEGATAALIEVQKRLTADNFPRPRQHHLRLRIGVHYGRVLTDGVQVTGDSVNLAARVASTAQPGEIRLTREAFQELKTVGRAMCTPLAPVELKGIPRPVELLRLDWRDPRLFPDRAAVQETGDEIVLPQIDTIAFGRLRESDGAPANDVVLQHPDPAQTMKISRWHFELRRLLDGFALHQISEGVTEVDGQVLRHGQSARVRMDTVVRVAGVLTLVFKSSSVKKTSEATFFNV